MIRTKYGNTYTNQEWEEMMSNWDLEYEEAGDYLEKLDAIKSHAARMLEDIGVNDNACGIADRIFNYGTDGIEFSSQEKQLAVEQIATWMQEQERTI